MLSLNLLDEDVQEALVAFLGNAIQEGTKGAIYLGGTFLREAIVKFVEERSAPELPSQP